MKKSIFIYNSLRDQRCLKLLPFKTYPTPTSLPLPFRLYYGFVFLIVCRILPGTGLQITVLEEVYVV